MLCQMYLESSKRSNILYVINSMDERLSKGVVVLVPGFSQSKSDVDYFMSKLANRLFANGYITVQVDLYAHGDSYGSLEDFIWEDFIKNIEDIQQLLKLKYKNIHQYMVTRGIYGNIAMSTEIREIYDLVCLNPVNELSQLSHIFNMEAGVVELNTLLAEQEEYTYLFETMGSEISNLRGQMFNKSLIASLAQYQEISLNNTVWSYDSKISSLKEQARFAFVRDPEWQELMIDELFERLEEIHSLNV